MKTQDQIPIHQCLHELDDLYCTTLLAEYEAALQSAVKQLGNVVMPVMEPFMRQCMASL